MFLANYGKKKTHKKSSNKMLHPAYSSQNIINSAFSTHTCRLLRVCVCTTRNTVRNVLQYARRIFQQLICDFNILALNPRISQESVAETEAGLKQKVIFS